MDLREVLKEKAASISAKMRDVLSQEDRKEETIQDSDFIQNIKSTKRNLKKVRERVMARVAQHKTIHQLITDEIQKKLAAKRSKAPQSENVEDGSDSENSEFEKIVRLRKTKVRIVGARPKNDKIKFLVEARGKMCYIDSERANRSWPKEIITFYESHVTFHD